jgi:hypothetical protein
MTRPFTVTVRNGPKVEHRRAGTLAEALDALEGRMRELSGSVRRPAVDLRYKRFDPIQQVAARGEVAGPARLRGGVDLRGDGSVEAFTGRLRRRLVAPRERESAYDALRRALGAGGGASTDGDASTGGSASTGP